jgi:ribosomal protein S27E
MFKLDCFSGCRNRSLIYDHPMTNPKPELSDPCAEILALC